MLPWLNAASSKSEKPVARKKEGTNVAYMAPTDGSESLKKDERPGKAFLCRDKSCFRICKGSRLKVYGVTIY